MHRVRLDGFYILLSISSHVIGGAVVGFSAQLFRSFIELIPLVHDDLCMSFAIQLSPPQVLIIQKRLELDGSNSGTLSWRSLGQ